MAVKLSDLQTVNTFMKQMVQAEDVDHNGTLTEQEIENAYYQQPDGFAAANALAELAVWARLGHPSNISVASLQSRADLALKDISARDSNQDGVLDGKELASAQQLKIFDAYASVLPTVVGPLGGFTDYGGLLDGCTLINETNFTNPANVPPALASLMVTAANESSYKSNTIQDVFNQVEDGEVMVRSLEDPVSKQLYLAVDYGAGDNTYGAIFDGNTLKQIAAIHDSDLVPTP